MPAGKRCSICALDWPDERLYDRCPSCHEATSRFTNLSPMTSEEGESRIAHIEFEKFYERYCHRRNQPVEGNLSADLAELLPDLA